jgi:hypothetical protein
MKAFWQSTKASLLKSSPPGVGWGKREWNAYLLGKSLYVIQVDSDEQCGSFQFLYMPPPWNGRGHIVLHLSLRHSIIIGFRLLSLERLHKFNSNLVYGYIIGLCRSSSNLVMVQWSFDSVIPLEKFFSFHSLTFVSLPGRLSGELLSWPRCRRRRHTSRKKLLPGLYLLNY